MKCKGKLQMVKISHIEEIYDYKDRCFHKRDVDGYSQIYFRCNECGKKYEIEIDNCEINSIEVEKLYIKGNNNYHDIGSELNINEVNFKPIDNKN